VDRFPIDQYRFNPQGDDWFGGNEPLSFTNYQSSILGLTMIYTPFQKYMTEPNRKVVLGSKWPSFRGTIERGLPNIMGSDIDYTYLQGTISQSIKIGTIGNTDYQAIVGKFINTNDLSYVDQKLFPRGDQLVFCLLNGFVANSRHCPHRERFLSINCMLNIILMELLSITYHWLRN